MAQAPRTNRVFSSKTERLVGDSFLLRDHKNWHIDRGGSLAQCNDGNYGNVAIFSKRKFRRGGNTSLLLTISFSSKNLEKCTFGLADEDFMTRYNDDMRSQEEYGDLNPQATYFWQSNPDPPRPGNPVLGEASGVFNIGVKLSGETRVGGLPRQAGDEFNAPENNKLEIRLNIANNEFRVIAPDIWGDREIVESISTPNEFRLAICAPHGMSFALEEIQERFTLKNEAIRGLDLGWDDEKIENWCHDRYKTLVKRIRNASKRTNINIVVVGAFGAGKSSLVNTLLTALSGGRGNRIKTNASVKNDSSGHGTLKVRSYKLKGTELNLLDTIGLESVDDHGEETNWGKVLKGLLRGNIRPEFHSKHLEKHSREASLAERVLETVLDDIDIEPATELKQSDETDGALNSIITKPLEIDEMNHGVLLVGNPGMEDHFGLIYMKIASLSHELGLPIYGVVTQLDRNTPDLSTKKLYTDPGIGENFDRTRGTMAVHCFPVCCYTRVDANQSVMKNWLAVEALDALFEQAIEFKIDEAQKRGIEIDLDLDVESGDEDAEYGHVGHDGDAN